MPHIRLPPPVLVTVPAPENVVALALELALVGRLKSKLAPDAMLNPLDEYKEPTSVLEAYVAAAVVNDNVPVLTVVAPV